MAIEFSIQRDDLVHAVKPFFSGRARGKSAALDYVDIKAQESEVEFVSTGFSSSLEAQVASSGCARLPFPLFEIIFRKPDKLAWSPEGRIAVRITDGHVQVGTTTYDYQGVFLQAVGARIVDMPIDAPLQDALVLSLRFSERELSGSGVLDRVEAAKREAVQRIEMAAKILMPLNITRETLCSLVWDQIAKPHERLRL